MGLRFRRSVKLFPGVRLNFGKKGISTSIGKRGAGVTFGTTGTTTHVGIPGTGISYVKKVGTGSTLKGNPNTNANIGVPSGCGCNSCLGWFVAFIVFGFLVGVHDKYGWTPFAIVGGIVMALITAIFVFYKHKDKEKRGDTISNANVSQTDQNNPDSSKVEINDFSIESCKKVHFNSETEPIIDEGKLIQSGYDSFFGQAARFVVIQQQAATSMLQRHFCIGYNRAGNMMDDLERLNIVGPPIGAAPRKVLVKDEVTLHMILIKAISSPKKRNIKFKENACPSKINIEKPFEELESLIGLDTVKQEILSLTNYIKLSQKRKENGLKVPVISCHCVFTGNSGTGKTTVARLLAGIFKDLGLLKKGHLIETDRSGLVAEYVGQTAVKTNKIIDSAIDGVLFIDEAYTLSSGDSKDYGHEAIATLLKRMEDDRDRLIVILAGYSQEMLTFINSNPGLRSRFNRYIEFPDYTPEELYQIFQVQLKKYEYKISPMAETLVRSLLEKQVSMHRQDFGNARFVRNIFEKIIEQQANRLANLHNVSPEQLLSIEGSDVTFAMSKEGD